jgi:hypothetical protein
MARWPAATHEVYRQVEQRTEPPHDIVAAHVLPAAELNVQSVAEVGERVAGDDGVDRRKPKNEVVVLATRVRGNTAETALDTRID